MGIHMQILIAVLLAFKRNWHIIAGLLLGIICGIVFPQSQYPVAHQVFSFVGQAFISIIQNDCYSPCYKRYCYRHFKRW